jgi:hypothetical protein
MCIQATTVLTFVTSKDRMQLVPEPKDIKLLVTGGRSLAMGIYVTNPGSAASHWVTKPIRLPKNWDGLLKNYGGWDTPIKR